ncbi:RNA-binding protein 5 [Paramyrothecium foliicola]|nr:RNA-binding protein 5 [Paramyrothecium foliicola]
MTKPNTLCGCLITTRHVSRQASFHDSLSIISILADSDDTLKRFHHSIAWALPIAAVMHDEHRAGPEQGRSWEAEDFSGREYDDQPEAPSRPPQEQDTRRQYGRYNNDRHGRYDGVDSHYARGKDDSRQSRHYSRANENDYRDMYDERPAADHDRHRGRFDDSGRSRDDRRSRSASPAQETGRPSDTVIVEGLPFDASAAEVGLLSILHGIRMMERGSLSRNYSAHHACLTSRQAEVGSSSVETFQLQDVIFNNTSASEFPSVDIRVSSSKGNRRAFVQFANVDHAAAFVKAHFPKLFLQLEHPTDEIPDGQFTAFIHYARSREDGELRPSHNSGNWICSSCEFSNYSTRAKCKICGTSPSGINWRESLTGAADAADVASQILVVYPLASFVDEEMLARDMTKLELQKPEPRKDVSGDAPKLKSTAPTSDAASYGARPGSLHRVFLMRDSETNESFKYGFAEFWTLEDAASAMIKFKMARAFTVAGCAVNLSTIHMGVFVPEDRSVTPAIEQLSFNPLFNPSLRVKYRDPHVYPSQRLVTSEPPAKPDNGKPPDDEVVDNKKTKKRKADGSITGTSSKKTAPMAGQMARWQKKHDELLGQEPRAVGVSSSESSGSKAFGKSSEVKAPIKISISGTKNLDTPPATTPGGAAILGAATPASQGIIPGAEKTAPDAAIEEELYMDRDRLMCLICMRKYKSLDEVSIHEKSRNHKASMENEELVKAALPRIAARDKRIRAQPENEASTSQYRDRAKERRQAFNQPKKQASQANKPKVDAKVSKDDAATVAKPAQSKGAGMLAKMGWTAGAGLGANGAGRTEVIATNAYQEGVGLGAEGGNLGDAAQRAEKKTTSTYSDYVNEVQDKARERYNRMN